MLFQEYASMTSRPPEVVMDMCFFILVFLFLNHCSSDGAAGVAAAFVALHIASHAEGFPAPGMCAAEGLLAGMAVRVNAQAGGS